MATPTESQFLLLRDYRVAGETMQAANLKLPEGRKQQLLEQARRMKVEPTTWGRHLLICGLEQAERLLDARDSGEAEAA